MAKNQPDMALDEEKFIKYAEVLRLSKDKLSQIKISEITGIPRTTVRRIFKKYSKCSTLQRLPGFGRRNSLNKHKESIIVSKINKNSFISSDRIRLTIEKTTRTTITTRTVRNYIAMTNFKSRVPRKLSLLSKKNIGLMYEIAMKWPSFENED
ncbi:hypothetical protein CDIK_4370 [Cucumispora dikerogammari]|nr:hypothetical protein CDIK_4370 [Cucumispora dikerogammari]